MPSLLDAYPIRVLVDGEDISSLVADGLTWSNVDPGGYEACTIPLPRDAPEMYAGQPIRIECGLQTAWEGEIKEIERSLGPDTEITGRGYGGALSDYLLSEVYVDRDLTQWQDPSYTRQIALYTANDTYTSSQVLSDPVNQTPAIAQLIQNSWASPWLPICEAWYDAGPDNLIAKVYYSLALQEGAIGTWSEIVQLCADADAGSPESSGNLHASAPVAAYFTPATAHRYAILQHFNSTTGLGVQGATYAAYWANVAAYGNHGLTGRGSDPVGFYPSDIAAYALSQLPSGLIVPGIIPTFSSYIVPHYVQYTPVAIEQHISDMAGLAGVHYGVWESLSPLTGPGTPRMDFRPYPTVPSAFCLRQDCDSLDITEDLSGMYDSAWVTYTDTAGVQQAVYVTLDNPYLDQVGLHRTLQIDAGTSTAGVASAFGQTVLLLSQINARASGSATFLGLVNGPSGPIPPYLLKSGIDRLEVLDLPGNTAFGTPNNQFQVSRVEASVTADGISTTVDLGNGSDLVEVLQAREQIASTLASVL